MIADKVLDMNIMELRFFSTVVKEKILRSTGINPMKMNLDWPSLKQDGIIKFMIVYSIRNMASS